MDKPKGYNSLDTMNIMCSTFCNVEQVDKYLEHLRQNLLSCKDWTDLAELDEATVFAMMLRACTPGKNLLMLIPIDKFQFHYYKIFAWSPSG